MSERVRLGSSHEGRYTYWQDLDNYVYQFNEREKRWNGWLCALAAWESTFSQCDWITLDKHRAACCGAVYTGSMEAFYASHDCPNCPTRGYGLHEEDGETGAECREPDPQGWS